MERAIMMLGLGLLLVGAASAQDVIHQDCFMYGYERDYRGTHTESYCLPWTQMNPQFSWLFDEDVADMGNYCRGYQNGYGYLFCMIDAANMHLYYCPNAPECVCPNGGSSGGSDTTAATTSTEAPTTTTTEAPTTAGGSGTTSGSGSSCDSTYLGFTSEHSKCKAPDSDCTFIGPNNGMDSVTGSDETVVLNAHNTLRNTVAEGTDGTYVTSIGPAKNMIKLEWDAEVASIAQAWADQCWDNNNLHYGGSVNSNAHDCNACRKTLDGQSNGQNMYWSASTGNLGSTATYLTGATNSWYSEIDLDFTKSQLTAYQGGEGIGHFTQVVWASTRYLGCGITRYRCSWKNRDNQTVAGNCVLVICNYKIAGNLLGAPVFESGSGCDQGTQEGFLCAL